MTENPPYDSEKIKEKLRYHKQTFIKRKHLIIKREELEDQLAKLECEKERLLRRLHLEKEASQAFQSYSQSLKTTQNFIIAIKQKKKELDAWLDANEELTEAEFKHLQHEWIDRLISLMAEEYQLIRRSQMNRLQELTYLENQLNRLVIIGQELDKLLQSVMSIRQSIKGRGILNYIFGISPNARIAQAFAEGQKIIQKTLPLLQIDGVNCPDLQVKALIQRFHVFLEDLHLHLKASWSFTYIDQTMRQDHGHLLNDLEQMNHYLRLFKEEKERLEEEIQKWME